MGERTAYHREYKRKNREIERQMRFRAWERGPNESLKDFKKRFKSETFKL